MMHTNYTINRWELHLTPEGEGDYIFIAVTINDPSRRGDETRYAEFTASRPLLDSWPQEEAGQREAALAWLDQKVDETHYLWMQTPPPPPPPVSLTPAEISALVLGQSSGERPVRKLESTFVERGETPESMIPLDGGAGGVEGDEVSPALVAPLVRPGIRAFGKSKRVDEAGAQTETKTETKTGEKMSEKTANPETQKGS